MRTCIRRVGESARVGRLAGKSLLRVGVPSAPGGMRTVAAKAMTETAVFLEEIAVSQTPKRLQGLMRVLEAQGGSSLSPADRRGLHPLLVPLVAQGEDVTCLLRWPEPSQYKTMPLPVVRMTRGAVGMTLVARSVDEYLHRLLAEEDFVADAAAGAANIGRPLLEAAGADAEGLFKAGDVAAAGLGGGKGGQQGLALYLIRKAGMFPDVCEQLALGHLARGDKTSAMVAAEWYMRNGHFVGWARPYEFASDLFMQLGRGEEGRDMARMGLRLPWWGLRAPFAAVATTAALPVEADRVMYLLSEEAAAAASATVNKTFQAYREPKTTKQLALERATALMNRVVAGEAEGGYDGIRDQLAAAYSEAGLSDVANFIQAA